MMTATGMKITSFFCFCACLLTASVIPAEHNNKDGHFKGEEHNMNYDHEAFLGKDEAAKFNELTPEQSKERLGKLMPVIDKDGDGTISEEELKQHISFMQKRYVQNDVERTWQNYGPEKVKDEILKWNDYREMVYGPEMEGHVSKEYFDMAERDRRRWKLADQTADDALDKEEYACFMHPEDCERMRDIVVQETLEDIDKDKDGFIALEEYISDMYRPDDYPELKGKEPDWVQSEREMFWNHRDKNKDKMLDKDEMREWIMPTGFDHADAEAKHLIHMADDNKDGKLDKDEVLAHYDVFVGSQATDYGEQLQKHDPTEL